MTHRGPSKMSVDELRQRARSMLAAKKQSGPMPALDNKSQAIFLLLTAGYSVKEIAAGLSISQNFVRVQRRRITQSIGLAPAKTDAKKYNKADAAECKRLAAIPDWSIDELFRLTEQLREALDENLANACDAATLRKMGRDDLVPRAGEARQQSDPPVT